MRLNHALTLDPTVFPKKMEIITDTLGNTFASTRSITKYLGSLHTWINCTTAWVAEEIKQLTLEQLTQLSSRLHESDINLTLQDSIFDTHTEDGYL